MKKITKEQRRESVITRSICGSIAINAPQSPFEPPTSNVERAKRALKYNMSKQVVVKADWNMTVA